MAYWAGLGDGELIQTLRGARLESDTARKYRRSYEDYAEQCSLRGTSPLPATPQKVIAWAARKARTVGNSVSFQQWVAHVRNHVKQAHPEGSSEWSRTDYRMLDEVQTGLNKTVGQTSEQWPGLTTGVLRRVYAALRPAPHRDGQAWAWWVYTLLAQQGMLRPNEACGGNLLIRDVAFLRPTADHPAGVRLDIWGINRAGAKSKKRKGLRTPDSVFVRQRGDELDVVAPLRRFFDMYDLRADPDAALFRVVRSDGALASRPLAADGFSAAIASLLGSAGVPNAATYGAKSCRSGRRTDLQNEGASDELVQLLGRWSSTRSSAPYRRVTAELMTRQPDGRGGASSR